MKNDGSKVSQGRVEKEPPISNNFEANKNEATTPPIKKKTYKVDSKKWTVRQHWQRASNAKRVEWIFGGVGCLVGLLMLCNYVWQNLETKWNFATDQRPRIAITSFNMVDVTTKAYGITIGHPYAVNINFSNVGKSAAYHLFPHRHVLSGKDYPGKFRIEFADTETPDQTLEPNSGSQFISAVSVKDTYVVETNYVDPSTIVPWDGILPIVVFGRITYDDSFGTKYCTPFGAAYYEGQAFGNLPNFPPTKIKLGDLCPKGTIQ